MTTRRQLLTTAVAAPAGLTLTSVAQGVAAALPRAPRVRGADISFTLQLERAGRRWSVDGRHAPLERLLRHEGANRMRLRVWVDPPDGYSDLDSAVVLARRAKAAGQQVLLDLHYSDFWADPAHQTTPEAWAGQDLVQLADTVRSYTRAVLEQLSWSGAPVDMVQIGNEVTAGMLWPTGQVYADETPDWHGFTTLLRAGIEGARHAKVRGANPRVMVHIDRGGDNAGARWFFDHVLAQGVDPDVIGLSYYPFWHGPMEDLGSNLADLAGRYGRDLVVVETAYPWTLRNGDDLENFIDSRDELPDADTWAPTPQGQRAYFDALRRTIVGVPGGRALGFVVWEPEWIPGVGWAPGEGNPNDNLTMFDWQGQGLPSLTAFGRDPMD